VGEVGDGGDAAVDVAAVVAAGVDATAVDAGAVDVLTDSGLGGSISGWEDTRTGADAPGVRFSSSIRSFSL